MVPRGIIPHHSAGVEYKFIKINLPLVRRAGADVSRSTDGGGSASVIAAATQSMTEVASRNRASERRVRTEPGRPRNRCCCRHKRKIHRYDSGAPRKRPLTALHLPSRQKNWVSSVVVEPGVNEKQSARRMSRRCTSAMVSSPCSDTRRYKNSNPASATLCLAMVQRLDVLGR